MPRIPTISIVVGLYLAGLLSGFGGHPAVVIIVAGAVVVGERVLSRAEVRPFVAIAVAGVLVGVSAKRDERSCAAEASASRRPLVVELMQDVSPGGFGRGRLARCGVHVSLLVASGSAAAGSVVRVEGERGAMTRGVMVRDATVRLVRGPGALDRLRARAGRALDRDFGSDAPLARALLIADTHGLSPELRDRFSVSGLAHILSISGLHVAIIALAIELVLGVARVPARWSAVLSLGIIGGYVLMLGAPAPAVRSAVMIGALSVSRMLQRPTSPWAVLTLGALQPVWSPGTVVDLGYQLSVLGVAALIAGGALVDRLGLARHPKWRRDLIAALICSTIATIASAPLVLWFFGRVSLIGPLSNLAAAPVVAVLQPMLFAALVLAPFPAAAGFVADACRPLLAALDTVARVTASVPNAAVDTWATPVVAVLAAVACGAVVVACLHERPIRLGVVAVAACAGIVWAGALPAGSGMAELHMLDVGQGDAIAVRTPRGRWLLFDAGRSWRAGDAGRSVIAPYVARRGGDVELFVLSHPHSDHVGGAASVLRSLRPRRYVDAAFAAPNADYLASLRAAREGGVAWSRVRPGDSLAVDGVVVTFLAPDSAWTASLRDPNDASTVALVRVGAVRMLLVGDAEGPEEAWMVERWGDALRADVLKVGHHGSSTSSTAAFLGAVRPRLALISVGAANGYGHPSPSVLADFARRRVPVMRTDRSGAIVVRTDGLRIEVDDGETRWALPPRRHYPDS